MIQRARPAPDERTDSDQQPPIKSREVELKAYMAIKKSELYSSLWRSCDELRGGMDASQYKDYVLVLLFMDEQDHREAGRGQRPQGRDRRGRLERRRQAGQGQGHGGPGRHLRQRGPG